MKKSKELGINYWLTGTLYTFEGRQTLKSLFSELMPDLALRKHM